MSGSLNKVLLIGNLGKDPETRVTQDGKEIVTFSVATTDSWNDKNSGEKKSRTEWHKVVVYNPSAVSFVQTYVKKGAKVYVEGQLQTRKWTDQAGLERYSTEILVQGFNGCVTSLDKLEKKESEKVVAAGGNEIDDSDSIPF